MSYSSPSKSSSSFSFSSPLFSSPGKTNTSINKYVYNKQSKSSKKEAEIIKAYQYFLDNNINFKNAINSKNINFDRRTTNVNPNNLIFWDNGNVYKIAPWSYTSNSENVQKMGIQNEVKAYTILNQLSNLDRIHVPTMISYETTNIRGKIYALLIITRNQEVCRNTVVYKNNKNVHSNNLWRFQGNKQTKSYIILAEEFLAKYGITNNDLFNNVFVINHNTNKEDTFFIIDFEKATFNITEQELMYIFEELDKLEAKQIPFNSNISTIKKRKPNSPIKFNYSPSPNKKKFSFGILFENSPKKQKSKQFSLFGNSP